MLILLPSLILVVVALRQIYLVRSADLSPWKGGGFGMFASTDSGPMRRLRVTVEAPERSERVRVPQSLADLVMRARTLPTEKLLRQVAHEIALSESEAGRPVSLVHVEVWGTVFEPAGLEAKERLVRTLDYDLAQPAY